MAGLATLPTHTRGAAELSAYSEGEAYQQSSQRSHFGRLAAAGILLLIVGTCAVAITPHSTPVTQFRTEAVQQEFDLWSWISGLFHWGSAPAPIVPVQCDDISTFKQAQDCARLALQQANTTLLAAAAKIQTRITNGRKYLHRMQDALANATDDTKKQALKAVKAAEVDVETYEDDGHEKHAKAIAAFNKAKDQAEKVLSMTKADWLKDAKTEANKLLKQAEAAKDSAEDALGDALSKSKVWIKRAEMQLANADDDDVIAAAKKHLEDVKAKMQKEVDNARAAHGKAVADAVQAAQDAASAAKKLLAAAAADASSAAKKVAADASAAVTKAADHAASALKHLTN